MRSMEFFFIFEKLLIFQKLVTPAAAKFLKLKCVNDFEKFHIYGN